MKELRLHFTEALVQAAVLAFVFRSLRRSFGIGFYLALALVLIVLGGLVWQGDRSWIVGMLATVPVFVVLMFLIIYLAHWRNTVGRFRTMRVPEATFAYDEDRFTLASDLASATLPWSAITEIWRYPRFWLILYSRSQFSTLPLADLDAETRAFITRKTGGNPPPAQGNGP